MSEPQAARPTQHVSEKALEDLDHNVIEPPPVPRRDIPEGAGKVVFVGAGPGAPDLVSVRGARVIETADIIIWASSLVHPDMVARHKEGAELIDSASIPLEDLEPLYTRARDEMFESTDTPWAPWFVARSEDKKRVRLNLISHLLQQIPYQPVEQPKVKLPKRKIGKYQPANYPFKYIAEPF